MIPTSTNEQKSGTSDRRRERFVEVARHAFFAHGYGATSMSSIAAQVGGSKTTLWTYFPSKQDLFAAVLDDLVERYGRALEVSFDIEADVASELRRFGQALLQTLHSQPIVDMHRLVIGEAGRFPELGEMMYERGAARGKRNLRAFVGEAMTRGKLRAGDPAVAAQQLVGAIQLGSPQMHLLGLAGAPTAAESEVEIETAVAAFMRAWGI
ncbi:TetR/AcrR family transcriptional regulator [Sphingomonas sp. ID1715]|uniref:TetR/AcrR family transcriptional regulator n=1 Tax=Sphingomonas sp. ID1715 TaxID=1656898 RepID=UPI001487EC21|nr:TetR/AcrR family transcriptional regulator [Sphingomonas sp. ID1715]NNM75748.1 TetR/AcrR family transcriptional regulator [Sphingomonas sp. ID1715]